MTGRSISRELPLDGGGGMGGIGLISVAGNVRADEESLGKRLCDTAFDSNSSEEKRIRLREGFYYIAKVNKRQKTGQVSVKCNGNPPRLSCRVQSDQPSGLGGCSMHHRVTRFDQLAAAGRSSFATASRSHIASAARSCFAAVALFAATEQLLQQATLLA